MKNAYDYFWAKMLTRFTIVVFFSQLFLEVTGIITRDDGYEWVIYVCGAAFLASVFYSLTLIILNAWKKLPSVGEGRDGHE